jgi:hypothetical protein
MMFAGDEAQTSQALEAAENNNWKFVRDFPLHLYSAPSRSHMPEPQCKIKLAQSDFNMKYPSDKHSSVALPPGLSLSTLYSDFIRYLMRHTRSYFCDRVIDGMGIARALWEEMTIIFKLPFSWSIKERDFLRQAFLHTDPQFTGSLRFIEKGEALIQEVVLNPGSFIPRSPVSEGCVLLYLLLCSHTSRA